MLLEGISDSTDKVKRLFGMHVWPWLPTGSMGVKSGPLMAAAGTFEVVIKGKGGHAAAGVGMGVIDPTVAAAAAVTSLQVLTRALHALRWCSWGETARHSDKVTCVSSSRQDTVPCETQCLILSSET